MSLILTETEKKMYLLLSLIFEKIMDEEASYELGLYQWTKIRPEILQNIGLDDELWEKLSDSGDIDDNLQNRLATLRDKFESFNRDTFLNNIPQVMKAIS